MQNGTPNGVFTVSSAWNMIREHRPINIINKLTWNVNIPFKCSFLLRRAVREKLPTNEKLVMFGQDLKEHCYCHDPVMDIVEHIFRSGHFAKYVWKYFAASCGINCEPLPLHHFIMRWWDADYKNDAHRLLLQAAPVFICWNLWKYRRAFRYTGKISNTSRVKYLVIKDSFFILKTALPYITWPTSWNELINLAERCFHDIKITPV